MTASTPISGEQVTPNWLYVAAVYDSTLRTALYDFLDTRQPIELASGALIVDVLASAVWVKHEDEEFHRQLNIRPTSMRILSRLALTPDRVVWDDTLIAAAWGQDDAELRTGYAGSLRKRIRSLRNKIGHPLGWAAVTNVYGEGYMVRRTVDEAGATIELA